MSGTAKIALASLAWPVIPSTLMGPIDTGTGAVVWIPSFVLLANTAGVTLPDTTSPGLSRPRLMPASSTVPGTSMVQLWLESVTSEPAVVCVGAVPVRWKVRVLRSGVMLFEQDAAYTPVAVRVAANVVDALELVVLVELVVLLDVDDEEEDVLLPPVTVTVAIALLVPGVKDFPSTDAVPVQQLNGTLMVP